MSISAFAIIGGIEIRVNHYLVTLSVILFIGVIILLLEKILPFNRAWLNHWDWNLDLTYYITNYIIKLLAQFQIIWLSGYINFLEIFPRQIPFWLQVVFTLTIIDFFLFLIHKLSHKYEFLWKLHAIHHSSERLYFLNGDKRHALHQIIEGAPGIILCTIIGTPPLVIITALALLAINMFMQHTNLDYKAGILKKIFCVAELHRWHHRAEYQDAQVNFGAWLTVWDYIFQSNYDTTKMTSKLGAIGIKEEPNFPRTYLQQFLNPFKTNTNKV